MKYLSFLLVSCLFCLSSCIGDCSGLVRCYPHDVTLHFRGYVRSEIDSLEIQRLADSNGYSPNSILHRRGYNSSELAQLNSHSDSDSLAVSGLGITSEYAASPGNIDIVVFPAGKKYRLRNFIYDQNAAQYETRKCNESAKGCERKLLSFMLDGIVYADPGVRTVILSK
jgi:hypothetical protein